MPGIFYKQATTHRLRDQSCPRGDSPQKGPGCSWEILKRTPRMYEDPAFGCGLKFFATLRDTNSKTTGFFVIFRSAQYPKRYRESSRFGLFETEHSKR